jgi:predicted PurR-regulated permease PerM
VALVSNSPLPKQTAQDVLRVAAPIVAFGVAVALLYYGRLLFVTSIVGVILAFILEPFVMLLMRLRLPRGVASFLVCAVALLFLYVIGLGAYSQLASLYGELPKYGERIGDVVDTVSRKMEAMEQETYRLLVPGRQRQQEEERLRAERQAQAKPVRRTRKTPEATPPAFPAPGTPGAIQEVRIHEERTPIGDYIYARLGSVYQVLLMASFVPFLVYFMLSWRDHVNRSFLQFFHGEARMVAARSLEGIAEMARAFVVGNFLLGFLLALVSSLAFWLIKLPYPLLVGPLSGFLSLVPYVGLPLATIPPLFAALLPNTASIYVLVLVLVAVFHLIALNLLYPKVVGARVHLNPLVVTLSLMFWGFIWNAAGLLLAIPLTAGIKAVCDNVKGLRPFGKFLGD